MSISARTERHNLESFLGLSCSYILNLSELHEPIGIGHGKNRIAFDLENRHAKLAVSRSDTERLSF